MITTLPLPNILVLLPPLAPTKVATATATAATLFPYPPFQHSLGQLRWSEILHMQRIIGLDSRNCWRYTPPVAVIEKRVQGIKLDTPEDLAAIIDNGMTLQCIALEFTRYFCQASSHLCYVLKIITLRALTKLMETKDYQIQDSLAFELIYCFNLQQRIFKFSCVCLRELIATIITGRGYSS